MSRAAWAGLAIGAETHVMGVINMTPDSFSGDGLGETLDPVMAAVEQARAMRAAGAALLDIGGESTRPGAEPVDAATEIARIAPAIRAIRSALPDSPIAVDTMKAAVAAAALDAGAQIVNDVTGFAHDPEMAVLCAARGASVILMHNAVRAGAIEGESYAAADPQLGGRPFIAALGDALAELRSRAEAAGIAPAAIMLDPGIGFGKSVAQNLAIIAAIPALRAAAHAPLLIGASRKSFLGRLIGGGPQERGAGDAAVAALAAAGGADMIRVHDVAMAAGAATVGRAVAAQAA